ncbi:MAG TPA: hypothetical protein PK358_12850 [Spirochaetota bacterium]|nr:hypothetical protein [Spirochaetota bacterium]HPJ35718.1 hypothetical protein [Spirochaetota bacterium]
MPGKNKNINLAILHDFLSRAEQAGISPEQIKRIRNYFDSDRHLLHLNRCPDIIHVMEFITGLREDYPPDTEKLAEDLDGREFIKILNSLDQWTNVDERIFRILSLEEIWPEEEDSFFYKARKDIMNNPSEDIYSLLVERLSEKGYSKEEVFSKAMEYIGWSVTGNDGQATSLGRFVLGKDMKAMTAMAVKAGITDDIAELYIVNAPEKFQKDKGLFYQCAKNDKETSVTHIIELLLKKDPAAYKEDVLFLIDSLKEPYTVFIAAFLLLKYYPDTMKDPAYKLGEKAAIEILPAENDKHINDKLEFAAGFRWLKFRIIDWLLSNFGMEAKKIITTYREENTALRLEYYELVARHLGEESLDILVEGLLKNFNEKSIYGNIDYKAYVKKLLSLITPHDYSRFRDKIESHFAGISNKKAQELVSKALKQKADRRPKPQDFSHDNRWLFDEFAADTEKELLKKILPWQKKNTYPVQSIDFYMDEDSFEEGSYGIQKVNVLCEDGTAGTFMCTHACDWLYHILLSFRTDHNYDDDMLNIMSTSRIPLAVLVHELLKMADSISSKLEESGGTTKKIRNTFYIYHDTYGTLKEFEQNIKRDMQNLFTDEKSAADFTYRCYSDPKKQQWLMEQC